MSATCTWCGRTFLPKAANARFCSSSHRQAFHAATRAYGERQFAAGFVGIEELRKLAEKPVHGSGGV